MPPIRRSAYLLAVVAFAGFMLSLLWRPAPPPLFVGVGQSEVPAAFGAWRTQGEGHIAPADFAALASADVISRTYIDAEPAVVAPPIDFVLIGGTDRSALHDPRNCTIGAGWQIAEYRAETLPGILTTAQSYQAIDRPGSDDYDIVYLYVVGGRIRTAATQIRAEMLASALMGQENRPVYFLRAQIPLAPDPTTRAANHRLLLQFVADAWNVLPARVKRGG